MTEEDGTSLLNETRRIWDTIAEWWDDKIGDGNDFQRMLLEPTTERLLGDISGGRSRHSPRFAKHDNSRCLRY